MTDKKDNDKTGGALKQTVDSVTALTKAVPIYEDAFQPAAKEIGKAGGTIGKAVNFALSPVSLVVWGYDKIVDFLETKVTEKLEGVPAEHIATPPLHVVGPAVEALKFTGHDETLRDMFANLIANSLDTKTVMEAHPSFVDIIKSLSPDEGLILTLFASTNQFPLVDVKLQNTKDHIFRILHRNVSCIGLLARCEHRTLIPSYLDNLCRLGILDIPSDRHINNQKAYEEITNSPDIKQLEEQYCAAEDHSIGFDLKKIEVTDFGCQFINACVVDKRAKIQ